MSLLNPHTVEAHTSLFHETLLDRIDPSKFLRSSSQAKHIATDPSNEYTACIDDAGNISISIHRLNRIVSIKPPSPTTHVTFTSRGLILVGMRNGQLNVYLADNGKLSKSIKQDFTPSQKLIGLSYSHSCRRVLVLTTETCSLYDSDDSFKKIKTMAAKSSKFAASAVSPDGRLLVTSFQVLTNHLNTNTKLYQYFFTQDGSVYLWDLSTFQVVGKSEIASNLTNQRIAISPDSSFVAIGGTGSPYIFTCDITLIFSSSQPIFTEFALPNNATHVRTMKFTHSSQLAVLTDHHALFAVDPATGSVDLEFSLLKNQRIQDFDISNNNELITLSVSGEIYKHDLKNLLQRHQYEKERRLNSGIEPELANKTLSHQTRGTPSNLNPLSHSTQSNFMSPSQPGVLSTALQFHEEADLLKDSGSITSSDIIKLCTFPKHTLEKMFKSSLLTSNEVPNMTPQKLRQFLTTQKTFPDKHRALIYKTLLELPLNLSAFAGLVQVGMHPSFRDLYRKYPISDPKLYNKLQTVMSCLANHSEIFGQSDQLIAIAFPFIKIFAAEELLAFEIIYAFTQQFLQHFFVDFPHPPIDLLQAIDEIIRTVEPALHAHLKARNFKFVDYLWPLLSAFFTSTLDKESWLAFIDHVIAYKDTPQFFLFFAAQLLIYFKQPLMRVRSAEEMEIFVSRQNPVDVDVIIRQALQLLNRIPASRLLVKFNQNLPLPTPNYPEFTAFNAANVAHSKIAREQETDAERRMEESKHKIRQMQSVTEQILAAELREKEKAENLIRAEQIRREELRYAAEARHQRQAKIDEAIRLTRLNQLNRIEAVAQSNIAASEQLRRAEVQLLEAELQQQQQDETLANANRLHETQLLKIEQQAARSLREVMELREKEDRQRMVRVDMDLHKQQEDQRDSALMQQWRLEDTEMRIRRETLRQQKVQQLFSLEQSNEKKLIEAKLLDAKLAKAAQIEDIEKERRIRQLHEKEMDANHRYAATLRDTQARQMQQSMEQLDFAFHRNKQAALSASLAKLNVIQQHRDRLIDSIQLHRSELQKKAAQLHTAGVQQTIEEHRRRAEDKIRDEETKLQKVIIEIEDEKKIMQDLQNDIRQRDADFNEQTNFHEVLVQGESRKISQNRRDLRAGQQNFEDELSYEQTQRAMQNKQKLQEYSSLRDQQLLRDTNNFRESVQQHNLRRLEATIAADQSRNLKHNNHLNNGGAAGDYDDDNAADHEYDDEQQADQENDQNLGNISQNGNEYNPRIHQHQYQIPEDENEYAQHSQ